MADRRKREIGQVWRCNYGSFYQQYYIPAGDYLITGIESDILTLFDTTRHKVTAIPRKMLTSADDQFSWIRSNEVLPEARPQFVSCRYCQAGDVVTQIGKVERFVCRFCGRNART